MSARSVYSPGGHSWGLHFFSVEGLSFEQWPTGLLAISPNANNCWHLTLRVLKPPPHSWEHCMEKSSQIFLSIMRQLSFRQNYLAPCACVPLDWTVDNVAELLFDGRRLRALHVVHRQDIWASVTNLLYAGHRPGLDATTARLRAHHKVGYVPSRQKAQVCPITQSTSIILL